MKKSRFLTFIFALMPGAGQMYLGLMTKGVVLMSLFFGIIMFAASTYQVFIVAMPVIWFYSFFDALNYNSKPYETKTYVDTRTSYVEEPYQDILKIDQNKQQ